MKELQELLQKITGISEETNVDMVFGAPQEVDGRTLIPVAEVSYGFGAGLGSAPHSGNRDLDAKIIESAPEKHEAVGGGGGGGAKVRPIAYIEVDSAGAKIVPILDEKKIALAGILLVAWICGWSGLVLKTLFKK
ncbi:MAG: spore germination protein GerW family protein [Chloroflexota bacterium]|nr:spore germination protein GerW family protein [Chloroflexota bacterium]